ncbi:MAG: 50S ribosomal protein L9 [Pseudomonadota bacterium]
MDVILLEKVENLGGIGDKVTVKSGYGRNFLLPQGKATLATPQNLQEFEARRAELEAKAAEALAAAQKRAATLEGARVEIKALVGSEGKLFGSIGTIDIAQAFTDAGMPIERAEIRLTDEGTFREVGEYPIGLHLHSDVDVEAVVAVVADEGK